MIVCTIILVCFSACDERDLPGRELGENGIECNDPGERGRDR